LGLFYSLLLRASTSFFSEEQHFQSSVILHRGAIEIGYLFSHTWVTSPDSSSVPWHSKQT